MHLSKKNLVALLVFGISSFGFDNYTYVKGKEYKIFCCEDKDYFFYSASISDKKISWDDHIKAERNGLTLICSSCHSIHS